MSERAICLQSHNSTIGPATGRETATPWICAKPHLALLTSALETVTRTAEHVSLSMVPGQLSKGYLALKGPWLTSPHLASSIGAPV